MSVLFSQIAIGKMTVKNRFVRSATQDYLGNPDGSISDKQLELYKALAKGGAGLIISGHAYVSYRLGKASVNQNAIYDDKFIDGFKAVAKTVQADGAAFVLQISHAGRQVSPDWQEDIIPIAPSAVKDGSIGITPREMTEDEIWQLIDDYVAAMVRAKAAGCDGLQLHIAHGYCLSQFISPYTNRRTDGWGGSIENRTRILHEIISRGRKAIGEDYPVLAKLNSTDGYVGEGYLSLPDVVYTARALEKWGIAAIEVSGGIREAKGAMSKPGIKKVEDEAYFAAAAKAVKAAIKIPVILVGGLRSLSVMESVVTDNTADLVAICRPLIKEPGLVLQFKNGREKADCISCNACFNPLGARCYLAK